MSAQEATVCEQQGAALKLSAHLTGSRSAALLGRLLVLEAYNSRLSQVLQTFQEYGHRLDRARLVLESAAPSAEGEALAGELSRLEHSITSLLFQSSPCVDSLLALADADGSALLPGGGAAVEEAVQRMRDNAAASEAASVLQAEGLSAADKMCDAFARLRRLHVDRFKAGESVRGEQERLQAELAEARAAVQRSGADAAGCELQARLAGANAAVAALGRAMERLRVQQAAGAQRRAGLQETLAALGPLERQEEASTQSIQALRAADDLLLTHWRQDAADLRAFLGGPIAGSAAELRALCTQLPAAMSQELAAFRQQGPPPEPGRPQVPPAALKLDPLCHVKLPQHRAELAEEAGAELEQLRPLHQRWAELLQHGAAQLGVLSEAAGAAEAASAALAESSSAAAQQLEGTLAAAEDGTAAVHAVRSALLEWWSSPALYCAGPDLKVDGKTAPEWLRLLSEQREALDRRTALSDRSNV